MASPSTQWPPLLAQALSEIESAESLVTWGHDAWGHRCIVGLRELRVAALLFACSQEQEESSASSRWAGLLDFVYVGEHLGSDPASLLDLAVRLGLADIARCLRQRGLRQQRALGPYDLQRVPTASLAKLTLRRPQLWTGGPSEDEWFGEWHWDEEAGTWVQESWSRCQGCWGQEPASKAPLCPWTWEAVRQEWASDWNASTVCARMLVDAPATRAALALAAEGVALDLEEGAELRLLDAALLLGDAGAAAALAGRCGARRPARFWRCEGAGSSMLLESVEAHLRAGHRDLLALGFPSAAEAAVAAVRNWSCGLARALSEVLGEGELQTGPALDGSCCLLPKGSGPMEEVNPRTIDALLAFGSPPPVCRVGGFIVERQNGRPLGPEVSPLLFCSLFGDGRAARRLVLAGSTFQSFDLQHAWLLADPGLRRASRFGFHDLKPIPRRLGVAEGTLRQLFAAALRRSRRTLAATKGGGILRTPALAEHVAGFSAVWSDAEEGMRQEVKQLLGRDPLGDISLASCSRRP